LLLPLDTEISFGEVCKDTQFDCKQAGCKDPKSDVCTNPSCIPKAYVNDGRIDCADGSDEGTLGKLQGYIEIGWPAEDVLQLTLKLNLKHFWGSQALS